MQCCWFGPRDMRGSRAMGRSRTAAIPANYQYQSGRRFVVTGDGARRTAPPANDGKAADSVSPLLRSERLQTVLMPLVAQLWTAELGRVWL